MKTWKYYQVQYRGSVRFETLSAQEAENYARALWSRDENMGLAPTIDEFSRSESDRS